MNLESFSTPEGVARRAVDIVARNVAARADARIVLPAGATPVLMYAELVRRCQLSELDLAATHLFQLDEFVGVPGDDPRGFHSFLKTHLLDHVARTPGRDHLLDGARGAPEDEVGQHAARLEDLGGADLVLLGLGRNGHVAFNEPGSTKEEGARVVALQGATLDGLAGSFGKEGAPCDGMTLGLAEITAGRELVLLVTGAGKASVLRRLLEEPVSPSLPASLMMSHKSLTILADADALASVD